MWSSSKGSRKIEHRGSAHTEAEVELLKAAGRQKLLVGQGELDLGLQPPPEAGGPLRIRSADTAPVGLVNPTGLKPADVRPL